MPNKIHLRGPILARGKLTGTVIHASLCGLVDSDNAKLTAKIPQASCLRCMTIAARKAWPTDWRSYKQWLSDVGVIETPTSHLPVEWQVVYRRMFNDG
ncbi:MAG: hypothetical protein LT106_08980 [Burkholderiaceae bacterium]|nr:hypothetical protein [Burkholderiaceae bacterium]